MLKVKLKVNNDSFVVVPLEVDSPVYTRKHYARGINSAFKSVFSI